MKPSATHVEVRVQIEGSLADYLDAYKTAHRLGSRAAALSCILAECQRRERRARSTADYKRRKRASEGVTG